MNNKLKIERSSEVEDYIQIFEAKRSALEYQSTYGDSIAKFYEQKKLLIFPIINLDANYSFLSKLTFPQQFKKISGGNGIGRPLFDFKDGKVTKKQGHPIHAITDDIRLASMINDQISTVFWQLRLIIRQLFPAYRSMSEGAMTWRFTPTRNENTHFDAYESDSRFFTQEHRIKFFINLDNSCRVWRLTHRLDHILSEMRDILPVNLPENLNDTVKLINQWEGLQKLPHHEIHFPKLCMLVGNTEVIGHQVVYGNRMVAGEFFVDNSDMLDPSNSPHENYDPNLRNGFVNIFH